MKMGKGLKQYLWGLVAVATIFLYSCSQNGPYLWDTTESGLVRSLQGCYDKMAGTYKSVVYVYLKKSADDEELVDSAYCLTDFKTDGNPEQEVGDPLTVRWLPVRLLSYFFFNGNDGNQYRSSLEASKDTVNLELKYDLKTYVDDIYQDYDSAYMVSSFSYYLCERNDLFGTDKNQIGIKYLPGEPVCDKTFTINTSDSENINYWFAFNGEAMTNDNKEPGKGLALYPSKAEVNGEVKRLENQKYYLFIRIYEDKTD